MSEIVDDGTVLCDECGLSIYNCVCESSVAKEKGEKMPTFERSEMAQEYGKDHPWPTFDDWHKEHHEFGKIAWPCLQPLRCLWRWTRKTDARFNQSGVVFGPPAASEERGLREALTQWKCPACGGSKRYRGYSKEAAQGQECRKCKDTDGLHPIAFAALQSVPSSLPHQIANVTVDAPKGIPSYVKVEPSDAPQPDYRERLIEVAQALGYDASIVDNESCNALAHSVKALAENYARLVFAAPEPKAQPRTCQEEQD